MCSTSRQSWLVGSQLSIGICRHPDLEIASSSEHAVFCGLELLRCRCRLRDQNDPQAASIYVEVNNFISNVRLLNRLLYRTRIFEFCGLTTI